MESAERYTTHQESVIQVAKNLCYEITYSPSKNRFYYTIHGFWKNCEAVPDFIKDWHKAVSLAKPGFTLLSDLRTMITHPQPLKRLHVEAQQLLCNNGLLYSASVEPRDKIAMLQLKSLHAQSSLPSRVFASVDEAETYLDQKLSSVLT